MSKEITSIQQKSFEKELISVLREIVYQIEIMNENLENIQETLEKSSDQ